MTERHLSAATQLMNMLRLRELMHAKINHSLQVGAHSKTKARCDVIRRAWCERCRMQACSAVGKFTTIWEVCVKRKVTHPMVRGDIAKNERRKHRGGLLPVEVALRRKRKRKQKRRM